MLLLLSKMIRSLLILALASTFLIYLILISTNDDLFANRSNWEQVGKAILLFYEGLLVEHSLGVTRHHLPVLEVVPEYFLRSLRIILPAFFISIIFGVLLGLLHFINADRKINKIFKIKELIFGTIPDFIIFISVQYFLLIIIRMGFPQMDLYGYENWYNTILPIFIISITPTFYIANLTFHSLFNEKDKDYVRTAYSKGTNHFQVTMKHLLWNSWSTILSYTQTVMLIIITSLPIIEKMSFYKGAGNELLVSIKTNDTSLILGFLLPFLLLVLISIWITDIAKYFLIPISLENELDEETISKANRFKLIKGIYYFFKEFPYRKVGQFILFVSREYPAFALGSFFIGTILFIAIVGPLLPFIDKQLDGGFRAVWDENHKLLAVPVAPGDLFVFGTDRNGRDLLSMIVIGAKETLSELLVITLVRFILSIPLGYLASVHKGFRFLLGLVNSIFSFLPTIILVMLLANIESLQLSHIRHTLLVLLIALIDIGRIGEILRQEFIKINKTEFMIAAISVGNNWYNIITRYYIPNIYQKLIFILISDMARVMVLLGGLGIVEVYLSQLVIIDGETGKTIIQNLSLSWPSLLANSISDIRTAPWIPFFPSLFMAITIIGLNLFGSGLKDFLEKKKKRHDKVIQEPMVHASNETEQNVGL